MSSHQEKDPCTRQGIEQMQVESMTRWRHVSSEFFEVWTKALSEEPVVGPRASVFSSGKDGEAGDVGSIVDAAGCRQVKNKPLEARSGFLIEPEVYQTIFDCLAGQR